MISSKAISRHIKAILILLFVVSVLVGTMAGGLTFMILHLIF